jgi:hypothetical protein
MRSEFKPILELIEHSAIEDLPILIGQLEEIRVRAFRRLSAPPVVTAPDTLLDVRKAAKRLGVKRGFLYRHHAKFSFTRRMGTKLLFSANGLEAYIERGRK